MQESRPAPSHVADSPFFWLALFSGTALLCLAVIWSKYTERQQRIEANYRMRESLQSKTEPARQLPIDEVDDSSDDPELIRSLRPLLVIVSVLFVVSLIGLVYRYCMQFRTAGDTNTRDQPL